MVSFGRNKRLYVYLSAGALLLSLLFSGCAVTPEYVFQQNNGAVVRIISHEKTAGRVKSGSGFVVRSDGVVATNFHVIEDAVAIDIKAGGRVYKAEGVVYMDKANDVVLIKADADGLNTVRLGDTDLGRVGDRVYVISSPKGLENTLSDGILSGVREMEGGTRYLQISAPISSGSSGSPVFNEEGEVIGITKYFIKGAQNLNFAVPSNIIKDRIYDTRVTPLKDAGLEGQDGTAEYCINLGLINRRYGSHADAADAFKEAVRVRPDDEKGHICLGMAYDSLGRYEEAAEAYKDAADIKPDDPEASTGLAGAYIKLGKYKEAVEACKKALRVNPDHPAAHYNIGLAYSRMEDKAVALEEYKVLKDLDMDLANDLLDNIYK